MRLYLLPFLVLLVLQAGAQERTLLRLQRSVVTFVSDAPMEHITASNTKAAGVLDPQARTFAVQIPTNEFQGFNSPLQREHFNENYMLSRKWQYTTFKGRIIEGVDLSVPGEYTVRAKGEFTLKGITKERIIPCNGGLAYSADLGLTWTLQTSGTTERLHGIKALDAQHVIAVGREGVLLRTTNGGNTWELSSVAGGEDLRAITFLDNGTTGLIAGPAGEILRSTDQGATWTSISYPSLLEAQAFATDGSNMVYAVGDNALILRSADQGVSWTAMTTTAFSELSGISVKDGVAIAVGANGTILKLGTLVGIQEDRLAHYSMRVYPNPSSGMVTLELDGIEKFERTLTMEIPLIDGRLVDRTIMEWGEHGTIINGLAPGNYIVKVMTSAGTIGQRQLIITGKVDHGLILVLTRMTMENDRNTIVDDLQSMDPKDRERLLSTEPVLWLGKIIQMNQEPRYHNSLDAIALLSNLNEIQSASANMPARSRRA